MVDRDEPNLIGAVVKWFVLVRPFAGNLSRVIEKDFISPEKTPKSSIQIAPLIMTRYVNNTTTKDFNGRKTEHLTTHTNANPRSNLDET
ncbi:hypothetical protein HYFRA_00001773 [Hymenoscyphus fraxineus]|uniref:Uncharacterized protein n=1 Tax=Hymenoscyphus fraxineus TaxID=746836 RepID=A0A9N9PMG5_9HELO|nr:hypothetical protein HYFRA_00001773 [Hymenoscyphus fraxineus]